MGFWQAKAGPEDELVCAEAERAVVRGARRQLRLQVQLALRRQRHRQQRLAEAARFRTI